MSEHSPLPWRNVGSGQAADANGMFAASTVISSNALTGAREAEYRLTMIVRAVNAHAELVAALTKIASGTEDTVFPFRCLPESEMKRIARDALAKVKQ